MLQFTFWAFPQHILLHFPNNLLHFPIKFASFTQKNDAFTQELASFPTTRPMRGPGISRDPVIRLGSLSWNFWKFHPGIFRDLVYRRQGKFTKTFISFQTAFGPNNFTIHSPGFSMQHEDQRIIREKNDFSCWPNYEREDDLPDFMVVYLRFLKPSL